jgi:hypothetical protein
MGRLTAIDTGGALRDNIRLKPTASSRLISEPKIINRCGAIEFTPEFAFNFEGWAECNRLCCFASSSIFGVACHFLGEIDLSKGQCFSAFAAADRLAPAELAEPVAAALSAFSDRNKLGIDMLINSLFHYFSSCLVTEAHAEGLG